MIDNPAALADVRRWIRESQSMFVLTGAGISTDSGLPDYRGSEGLWRKDKRASWTASLDRYLEDEEFRRAGWQAAADNPFRAEPNAGHRAVVELERIGNLSLLVTQNIDGLHLAAGSDPKRVIEIHGNLREAVCLGCGKRLPMERVLQRVRAGNPDPRCLVCGELVKPAVVSFGQKVDETDLSTAQAAAERCDLLLAVGSTLLVGPICGVLPIAEKAGARIVIVNGTDTVQDHRATVLLRGDITRLLTELVAV